MDKMIEHLSWCVERWIELGAPNPQEYHWNGRGDPPPEYQVIEGTFWAWEEWCLALYGPCTSYDEVKETISDDIPF